MLCVCAHMCACFPVLAEWIDHKYARSSFNRPAIQKSVFHLATILASLCELLTTREFVDSLYVC